MFRNSQKPHNTLLLCVAFRRMMLSGCAPLTGVLLVCGCAGDDAQREASLRGDGREGQSALRPGDGILCTPQGGQGTQAQEDQRP